jgi:nitroreductase
MDIYEAIKNRYSVRSYQDREIEQDKLDRILDTGRIAPSARNAQNWKFIVVRDADLREAIAQGAEQPFLAQAPVILAVASTDPERRMACGVLSGPVDCAIAIDHITLAAVAEGLGTCWIGHFDQDACCRILDVPPTAVIIELLAMGYPGDKPKGKSRKPIDDVVCYDKFA